LSGAPSHRRTVIVTGAAAGLGAATARLFAARGDYLILSDIASMNDVCLQIQDAGGQAVAILGDLTAAGQTDRIVAKALEETGRLDVLINNAGYLTGGTIETTSELEFDRSFAINVKAAYLLTRAAIGPLRAVGSGSVLFTTAVMGHQGSPNAFAYGACKAALIQMVRTLALDHARDGIRVNAVSPGPLRTSMLNAAADIFRFESTEAFRRIVPLAHITEPEEVAEAFYYLASSAARSITGHVLATDGGLMAGPFEPREILAPG
jgi:3-oxoacyl-[acyl-carrier protein] reductase